ncbi:MAG: HAMP domain-containing protein [Rhodocyclaceae bacterium]|nr:MAG: HAMP domain-containing protein [Rhodocyclaceae bacterium]
MTARARPLKFKVGLYLALTLTAAMFIFTFIVVEHQREELRMATVEHLSNVSEVITKSTRYAMLENEPEYVKRIIQDVGRQDNIAKVRVWSKDGKIIYSSFPPEVGQMLDRNADGCIHCYPHISPESQIPTAATARVFFDSEGRRMIGSMEVLHNEPACYNDACHEHKKSDPVLGVLDIVYSVDEIDKTMFKHSMAIAGFAIGFIVVVSLLVSGFVSRLVYRPLRDLEDGAKRLSSGNLDKLIPVRSKDEFGQVAESFNSMTLALKDSQKELQEWAHTLEQKVAERTSQLRIAEAETARSEKLASVGLLASGIAHELNNPLTGVLTFSHLLREKMPEGSQEAEDLDLVIRETKRCAAIIRRLLDFAREKKPEMKYADLNKLVENTLRMIEQPASLNNITLKVDLDGNLPPIWIDGNLIEQVILNILVNAQHSIENGGSIVVKTRSAMRPASPKRDHEFVPMAEIEITDSGCGISEKNLQRIFDPFFTTKAVGKGTGLGLSVSHGIVKAHGGTIEVASQVGKGSTFHVFLPLKAAPNGDIQDVGSTP